MFDPATGLWKFKCLSTHKPRSHDDPHLQKCVRDRDRLAVPPPSERTDGFVKGPDFTPVIPNGKCDCEVIK